jgi:UDP-N-acetylmuramoylalanine--D-glutamate ligase
MVEEIKNKKVLIFGLGFLGGGVEAAKWFYKNGAKIIITDKKTKKELLPSIKKLKKIKAKYVLGKHRFEDIDKADVVYFNPGVSYKSEWVRYAKEKGKEIVNDCYLFFKYAKGDIIAITGTRGKTTTTTWIYELLRKFFGKKVLLGGNQPEKSLFKILDKTNEDSISVLEISSFQLEFYEKYLKAPKIGIITNIYNDHLNRYSDFEEYAGVKANIFQNQTEEDYLILNLDNKWTNFFLKVEPKSQVYFVSLKKKQKKGIYIKDEKVFIRDQKEHQLFSIKKFKEIYGKHNLYNLLFALLTVYLYLKSKNIKNPQNKIKKLKNFILHLKTPEFRQEIIYKNKNLMIVNDSAATSPDATINAIERFKKYKNLILITGGTDKNLDFKDLAKKIKKEIKPENLILLNGSATKKLIEELRKIKYPLIEENIFEDLKEAVKRALHNTGLILFSPASASFEKFKNEFDRGKKFNKIIKDMLKLVYGRNKK